MQKPAARHSSAARQLRDSSDIVPSYSISVHQRCKDVPYGEVGRTKWHCIKSTEKKKALVSWRRYTDLRKSILWQGSVIKYNNHKSTRSQRDKGGGSKRRKGGGSLQRRPRPAGLGMDKLNFSQPRGSSLHRAHRREDYGSLGRCGMSHKEHVGTWWETRVKKWHQGRENLQALPRLIYMRREATEGKQQTKTRTHISGLLFFVLYTMKPLPELSCTNILLRKTY